MTSQRPYGLFQNKETAADLVFRTNHLGIGLYFYENIFFYSSKPIWPLVT